MLGRLLSGGWAIQLEAHGKVDERFEPVADLLLEGFTAGRDVGASVAVFLDGDPVINLWAGHRDRRKTKAWEENTLCCLFSVTKAVTSICVLQAVAKGLIGLDEPVASYWPEFAVNGKGGITVRQILSHRSGVVGFHHKVDREFLYDWSASTAAYANDSPWWDPGTRHGYHARSFGFLLGEILHRVSGKTVGEWLAEHVMQSAPGEYLIGLNSEQMDRCADMLAARIRPGGVDTLPPERREMMARFQDLTTATGAAFQNPSLGPAYMNSSAFRAAQLPAMNGHGTALGAAGIFARVEHLLPPELLNQATQIHSEGVDEVLRSYSRFGLGFMLYEPRTPIGLKPGSFGHAGAGGSMAFYDPGKKLSFCYVMNQMQEGVVTGGTSAMQIAGAVYDCID